MDKEPSSSVNEVSILRRCEFSWSVGHVGDLDGTRREEVDSRNSFVANRHLTFLGDTIESGEGIEVLEEGLVGSSHGQFKLSMFLKYSKVPSLESLDGLHL